MYGICNVVGASIPRNTDSGTYIHVGPEIGVASTKAFTGQVTVLMLLALCVGQMRGTVDDATVERIVRELKNMPLYILKSASNLSFEQFVSLFNSYKIFNG